MKLNMETAKVKQSALQTLLKKHTDQVQTNFLCSTPTLLSGAATVMNLAGSFYKYNVSKSSLEADFTAVEHDWKIIGQDFFDAIELVSEEYDFGDVFNLNP